MSCMYGVARFIVLGEGEREGAAGKNNMDFES